MSQQIVELLINVRSRRSREFRDEVIAALEQNGFELAAIHEVTRERPLDVVLQAVRKRSPGLLIVGGGDGTMSDTVDYFVGSSTVLAFVPLGTTNNFARSLNMPLDIGEAVRAIQTSTIHAIDLGKVNDDPFTNVAGVGLSARVASEVTNTAKRRWGRLAYVMVGLRILMRHRPFRVTIEDKDRELRLNLETHQIIVANGRYHAGKEIAEDVTLDNGKLIVFALGGRSRMSFLWHMLDFYVGRRKGVAHASYLVANNIRLQTATPQPVELDGEPKYHTPITLTVMNRAIKVRHPL